MGDFTGLSSKMPPWLKESFHVKELIEYCAFL